MRLTLTSKQCRRGPIPAKCRECVLRVFTIPDSSNSRDRIARLRNLRFFKAVVRNRKAMGICMLRGPFEILNPEIVLRKGGREKCEMSSPYDGRYCSNRYDIRNAFSICAFSWCPRCDVMKREEKI